jgi:hypothetical protein
MSLNQNISNESIKYNNIIIDIIGWYISMIIEKIKYIKIPYAGAIAHILKFFEVEEIFISRLL